MPCDVVELLSRLVALPSVNPMGRNLSGPEYYERRVTDFLQNWFTERGLPWRRQTVEPLRDNIVALIPGEVAPEAGGPVVLLEAHQDTVPVDGMTIPPFEPTVRDGRLWGRGACDVKGGMAAMLTAALRLHEERPRGRPNVLMACTVNEEFGGRGVQELRASWSPGELQLAQRRPHAAIIAEPTSLDVVVAHKGTCRFRCHTQGRAAHSSQPQLGDNAVYRMAPVLQAWERYARDVVPGLAEHRLCGKATLSVGLIRGGVSVNTVPDRCSIEIDRRIVPGEDTEQAYRQAVDYLAATKLGAICDPPFLASPALNDGANAELAGRLAAVAQRQAGRGRQIGVPFGTNASKIAQFGIPSVVFGPGSIDQAHTADEWLPIEELRRASEILFDVLRAWD